MLRRELNEILETNPKAEGKMTWNECLDYAAKNYAKIREWQSMPQKFIYDSGATLGVAGAIIHITIQN